MPTCSLCKSSGSTKATCPLNPKSTNPNTRKHPLAKNGGGLLKILFESDDAKRRRIMKKQKEQQEAQDEEFTSKMSTNQRVGNLIKAGRYTKIIRGSTHYPQLFETRELKENHCNKCDCCLTDAEVLDEYERKTARLRKKGLSMIGIT